MFNFQPRRKTVVCQDGFAMSVQASEFHYCHPRESGISMNYSAVEVGFPSKKEELLMDWAEDVDEPTGTVYGYVPSSIIIDVIEKHGGMVGGELPGLDLTDYDEEE